MSYVLQCHYNGETFYRSLYCAGPSADGPNRQNALDIYIYIYISVTKFKGCSRHLFSPTDWLPQITIVVSKLPIQLYLYFTNYPTPLYYIYKLPHPTILYLQITLPHYTQCCHPIRNFF